MTRFVCIPNGNTDRIMLLVCLFLQDLRRLWEQTWSYMLVNHKLISLKRLILSNTFLLHHRKLASVIMISWCKIPTFKLIEQHGKPFRISSLLHCGFQLSTDTRLWFYQLVSTFNFPNPPFYEKTKFKVISTILLYTIFPITRFNYLKNSLQFSRLYKL